MKRTFNPANGSYATALQIALVNPTQENLVAVGVLRPTAVYILNSPEEVIWCNSHNRRARYLFHKPNGEIRPCCGPGQSGITLPCFCVRLNGIAELVETDPE